MAQTHPLFARIAVVCATEWEMRRTIDGLGLGISRDGSEYRTPQGSLRIRISGMGEERAGQAARALIAQPTTLVLSAGYAGALAPELRAGDLLMDPGSSDPEAARAVSEAALRGGLALREGPFFCAAEPLMTASQKTLATAQTKAVAVEMESRGVQAVCRSARIPFCSVRAVSDEAGQNLPAAVRALDSEGRTGFGFWKAFLARPADWPDFLRLARSSGKAGTSLSRLIFQLLREAAS